MLNKRPYSQYPRPAIEVEVARHVQQIDGFDFVEAVIRICDILETAMSTISLERVRPVSRTTLDDPYVVHPSSEDFIRRPASPTKGYLECGALFLTRGHSTETGTVTFRSVLSTGTVLVETKIRFDSRHPEPVCTIEKGHLLGFRALPYLRTPEARAALNGRYPLAPEIKDFSPFRSETEDKSAEGPKSLELFPF